MADRELKRFPNKGKCAECPARRYYLESGRRYCENGHQVEGFVQFDVDAEDNFGKTGKVNRKQKEAKVKERKHVSGIDAKRLYLGCLQFILRKQLRWLIEKKGHHPELEIVCRDLLDLRLRGFEWLKPTPANDGQGKGKGKQLESSTMSSQQQQSSQSQQQSQSSLASDIMGLSMYSSQDEGRKHTESETDGRRMPKNKTGSWFEDEPALPSVMDTLALVYLACTLRREPVRIGDIVRWAKGNQIPFLSAIDLIPKDQSERLPGWAHRALLTRYAKFEGSELHKAVFDLMIGYKDNYDMDFPEIPVAPLVLVWIKDLALPLEVASYAQKFRSFLNLEFKLPAKDPNNLVDNKRFGLIDLPDVQLIACIVFATKFVAPLDDTERIPRDTSDPLCFKMDWSAWETAFTNSKQPKSRINFENLSADDAWKLSKEEMYEYMNWFQETQIDTGTKDETEIDRLFPLEPVTPSHVVEDMSPEEIEARIKKVQKATTYLPPRADLKDGEEFVRLGDVHKLFESTDELETWPTAKRFYEVVSEAAGLSLDDLVKAVYKLERRIWKEEKKERRRLKESQSKQR